jgi:hypothetical protein
VARHTSFFSKNTHKKKYHAKQFLLEKKTVGDSKKKCRGVKNLGAETAFFWSLLETKKNVW